VVIDGTTVAESSAPYLLFEPPLPVRYYFARDDVAWTYTEPLRDAAEITGRIAFFNERVDLVVDGERLERPITPWSR
jgi:uncharacterized protein (DUF427 family)